MNKKSRSSNAIKNILVALICQGLVFVFGFATKTVFIDLLGDEYNGLTSFFQNVVTMLSFTELGVGTAIVFALYKPIADNDIEKLKALMGFYKKIYGIIAVVVFALGLLITPFLKFFVETEVDLGNIPLYFIIFLSNSAVSYLFIYKSSILNADQRNRIVKLITTFFNILRNVIEIGVLLLTHNFIAYLIVQLVCTILNNLTISYFANKYYPWLKEKSEKLGKPEKRSIFSDVKSMLVYRIGGILLNNTSSIIMSKLVGVTILGFYSNYYVFVGALTTLLELVFSALTGSLGNLNTAKDSKSSEKVFRECNLLSFVLYTISSVGMFILLDDVIYVWLGEERVLGKMVCFAMASNFYIYGLLQGMMAYRNTTGLFRKTKYVILVTCSLNVALSIILGMKWGLFGILIASTIARLLTNFWYEPLMLYKSIFKMSATKNFITQGKYIFTTLLSGATVFFLSEKLVSGISILGILIKGVLCVIIPGIFILLFNFRTEEFKSLKNRAFSILKKITSR